MKKAAGNMGLAKVGLKFFDLTFAQSSTSVILLNFCAKNPRLRQAPKRWLQALTTEGKFKNLTQQNINYIFAALWKKHTNDYPIKRGL